MPGKHLEAEDLTGQETRRRLAQRLAAATQAHGVRLLYACVTGSRAFGWAGPTSDWDVRFIYAHAPAHYVTLGEPPLDVIDQPPDAERIELVGWDARKALRLALRSNLTLSSPLVIDDHAGFRADAARLVATITDHRVMARQHLAVAQRVWKQKLGLAADASGLHGGGAGAAARRVAASDGATADSATNSGNVQAGDVKPYLHLARALLSARWLLTRRQLPPVSLAALAGFDALGPGILPGAALQPPVSTALAHVLRQRQMGLGASGEERELRSLQTWAANEMQELSFLLAAFGQDADHANLSDDEAGDAAERFFHRAIGFDG